MAPEILKQQEYSELADVFSLGACVYFMLTGKFLLFSQSKSEIKYLNMNF